MLLAPNYQPLQKIGNQSNALFLNRLLIILLALLDVAVPRQAWAQSVKSAQDGTKTIVNQSGNQFNITGGVLSSNQANLFYSFSQFNLNQAQIANFLSQPQVKNILGRVVGSNPSYINGLIKLTGGNSNLFLINPAGIVFGRQAQLDVPGSFTATTATGIGFGNNMSFNATGLNDYAALVGNPQNFAFQISQPGSVINTGVLQVAQGQNLLLLGGNTINTGTLTAPSGNLAIAAVPGSSLVRISQLGHLLSLEISPQQVNINNGITALTLPELLTGAGLNPAKGVTVDSSGQTALVSGYLNVSGETGGTVEVIGKTVNLVNANINASGKINGGTILIGGDYQGKGTIPDSQVTFVDNQSEIKADAINSGNGGKVIVWSNDNTDFSGSISAKGGIQNGNGGFVEVSGKQQLKYTGLVDLRATNGETGNLLLDPATFVIANSGGDITPATVASQWNAANTTYSATTSLTVASSVTGNSANNLTLDAPTINLNAPITNAGAGNLTGTTNNITVNVGSNGLIQNGIDVAATGGNVNLAAANYNVTQPIAIGKLLTVTGAGASSTIVNGGGTSRVFDISGNGTNVALSEIEITNGNASNGGGIQVGIGSLLTLTDSNLVSNSASSFAGGIYLNGGTVTIRNSTLFGNSAGSGGGIYSNNGTATISNSTFSGNSASSGGGIYLNNGTTTISNSTFSGNSASFGGGIYNNFATVSVTNSIIAGDTATVSNNEVYSNGGTFTANGYNLVGVNGNAGGFPTTSSDIVLSGAIGTAIAPLGNYGGNTETFALVAGSPAIDAGNNTGSPSRDQRGALRGGFGGLNAGNNVDIGAFEATSSYVVSNTLDSSGLPLGSLRSAISFADNNINNNPANISTPAANTITFDSGVFSTPQTILLTAGELPITKSTTIQGTGSSNINISGNGDSRIFDISDNGTNVTLNNLTISNGNAGSNNGGGIQVGSGSTLNLNNSILNNNQASLGNSIYNTGTATISQSSITNSTTDNGGGSIYNLGGNLSLTNNSSVIGGNIGLISNGSGNSLSLGNISFSGQSGSNSLTTDSGGTTLINGNITTTSAQTYNDAVTLANNPTLTGNGITFNSTVDGNSNLTANTGNSNLTFVGAVGNTTALGNITANSQGTTSFNTVKSNSLTTDSGGTTLINGDITTTNAQTYNDAVTLANNPTLTGNGITFNSTVDGNSSLTANTNSGNLTFAGAVGSTTALGDITANSQGTTSFNTVNAQSLTTDSGGTTLINGNITTTNAQTYNDAVTLANNPALTGNGITFNNTVDGNSNLTANTGNSNLTFVGAVGSTTALGNITANSQGTTSFNTVKSNSLTTDSGGTTLINGNITTTNAQTYNDAVTLANNPTLTGNGITFSSTVDGNSNLIANTGNSNLTFAGAVGSTTALGDITANSQGITSFNTVKSNSLTTDAGGTTLINGNITTTNTQTYNDPTTLAGGNLTSNSGSVTFSNAVNVNKTSNVTANGSIDFDKTLDGSQNLSLSAGGNINFNGIVGSLTPQIGLTINNAANVSANDVNVASLNQLANSGNTTLGNVTAGSGVVNLISANNITTGNITTNGQEINLNSKNITTGNLTSVAQNGGNAGNITMVSNNQNVTTINAQGGASGIGGTVDLTVDNKFQATGTFTDQNGTLSSISTSGGVGSGPITIRYGIAPFIVGNGSFVGTAGAIASSSSNIISPPQTYYSTYIQGNISLIYRDATQSPSQQVTTLPEQVTTLPEQVLFPENTQFLPNSIIPNFEQSTLNQADLIKQTLSYNFSNGHTQEIIDSNIFLIEQLRYNEYTAYYGKKLAPLVEIQTAEDIKKSLKKIFEQTGKRSAVIYTLTQPESLEIIVVFPEGKVIYRNVKVKQEVLSSLTKNFRSRVVDPLKQGYKTAGQKIYNLLIAPIKSDLVAQKIDTLLFSVDDGLRSIPMAALFDGHRFLVENYSLGLIPSISLMDTHYKAIKNAKILAMGASKFVEQNALPGVIVELPVVSHQLGQGQFFINQEFTVKNLQAHHHEYPAEIIHLATHGEFNSGSPSNSFIQFWNKEKLRLDQVRKLHLQDPPIELLVLSACRTALGNEDVELGFAGLAIQSGSKSALASLWSVSDEGTLALMNEFYQNLKSSPIRAEAIQQAQIAMLKGKLYVKNGELQGTKTKIPLPPELHGLNNRNLSHPYYWAAFTMIGSPW